MASVFLFETFGILTSMQSETGHLENVQFNVTCDSSPSELVVWNIYNRTWETRQKKLDDPNPLARA